MSTEAGRRLFTRHSDCQGYCEVWGERDAINAIEAEAREQHEATLRERGWRDEYEAATDAAMNFGDGQAEARAALLAELEAGVEGLFAAHRPYGGPLDADDIRAAVLDLIRKAGEK